MTTTPYTLQEYEATLLQLINQQNKNWFDFGKKLAQVQSSNLHVQQNYKSFTAWLKAFSKQSEVGTTKLWKCLKVYKMIDTVDISIEEVSTDSINGLAKIADIHLLTKNKVQAKSLIEDFVNKKIKINELNDLAKSLVNNDVCNLSEIEQLNLVENEAILPQSKQTYIQKKHHKNKKWLVTFVSSVVLIIIFALVAIQKNFLQ
jgi:hypothetical protein